MHIFNIISGRLEISLRSAILRVFVLIVAAIVLLVVGNIHIWTSSFPKEAEIVKEAPLLVENYTFASEPLEADITISNFRSDVFSRFSEGKHFSVWVDETTPKIIYTVEVDDFLYRYTQVVYRPSDYSVVPGEWKVSDSTILIPFTRNTERVLLISGFTSALLIASFFITANFVLSTGLGSDRRYVWSRPPLRCQ